MSHLSTVWRSLSCPATTALLAGLALCLAQPTIAQCTNPWLPGPAAKPNGTVFAAVTWDPDGAGPLPPGVVVGGAFSSIGGVAMQGVALLDPATGTWSSLPGMPTSGVHALAVTANGDLIAGGSFLGASGVANYIARWSGSSWTALGAGVSDAVRSLLALPNGDVIAGGRFTAAGGATAIGVARWDGANWSDLPGLSTTSFIGILVAALAAAPNGDIVAGGLLSCQGGWNLARWNGSVWVPLGNLTSTSAVISLLALQTGEVIVGGQAGLGLWDGVSFQGLGGTGSNVRALVELPDGDVIAAGGFNFVGATAARRIARWSGGTWSPIGSGAGGDVYDIVKLSGGDLMVVGDQAGGAALMQRLTTTCPAAVVSYGAGCAGSGGQNQLAATTQPWIGSQFRAQATGMPGLALVLSVYGFTQLSIPLPTVIPAALPGCTVLMSGDHIDVLLPSAGAVGTALALPDAPSLVGAKFHHYVVPFEVGASLQVLAVTNSNALTCTIGAF